MKSTHPTLLLGALLAGAAAAVAQQPPGAPAQLTPAQQKAAAMRLPELDRTALTPDERRSEKLQVEETERNPFGMASKIADKMVTAEPVSEQKKIEKVLRAMRVTGFSDSVSGPRVMLGPLSLGVGEELPKLFFGQVERLVVKSITDKRVLLVFVEPEDSRKERSIGLPFNLRPQTNSLLVGEAFLKMVPFSNEGVPLLPPLQREAAEKALKAAKAQDLQGVIDRPTELFTAPYVPASDEKK